MFKKMNKIIICFLLCILTMSNFSYVSALNINDLDTRIHYTETNEAIIGRGITLGTLLYSYARNPSLKQQLEAYFYKLDTNPLTDEQMNDPKIQAGYIISIGMMMVAIATNPSLTKQFIEFTDELNPFINFKKIDFQSMGEFSDPEILKKVMSKENMEVKFDFTKDEVLAAREATIGYLLNAYARNPSLFPVFKIIFEEILGKEAPKNPSKTILEGTIRALSMSQIAYARNPSLYSNMMGESIKILVVGNNHGIGNESNINNKDILGYYSSINSFDKNEIYDNTGMALQCLLIALSRNPSLKDNLIKQAEIILNKKYDRTKMTKQFEERFVDAIGGLELAYARNPHLLEIFLELENKYNPYVHFKKTNFPENNEDNTFPPVGTIKLLQKENIESYFDLENDYILRGRERNISSITEAYARNPSLREYYIELYISVLGKRPNKVSPIIIQGTVEAVKGSVFGYARNPSLRDVLSCSLLTPGTEGFCSKSNANPNEFLEGLDILGYLGKVDDLINEKARYYNLVFDPNNGESKFNNLVFEQDIARAPYIPNKEGYEFIGWYDGDKPYDFSKPVFKGVVLTAKYRKKGNNPETSTSVLTRNIILINLLVAIVYIYSKHKLYNN